MTRPVKVTDHAIARLLERAPGVKGMPEQVIRSAVGNGVPAGRDQGGRALLASSALPRLLLVVAEEPTQRVVVSVIPHPTTSLLRDDAPSAGLGEALESARLSVEVAGLREEVARLRMALDAAVARLAESERLRAADRALLTRERDLAVNALKKMQAAS